MKHDVSPPLRTLIPLPPQARRPVHNVRIPLRSLRTMQVDTVVQSAPGPAVSTSSGLSFEGLGEGAYGYTTAGIPPDPNGNAGLTQYVQWVNTAFAVFDKATGSLLYGPASGNSLWSGFGGACQTLNDGDPIVQYDKIAHRWIMTQLAGASPKPQKAPFYQCIAVSTSEDATGTWNRYAFSYDSVNDYPKLSVWPDAYYITYNMFAANSETFQGAQACAFDRQAMLAGTTATQVCFTLAASYGGVLTSDLDGATLPPTGAPNYLLGYDPTTDVLDVWKFHVDFATPANSTLTGPATMSVAPFNEACNGGACIPQPGVTDLLDSLGDRPMYRLAYRNFGDHESLVVNHSVSTTGGEVGVRWYEVRSPGSTTPTLYQQGTFAPDSNYRWMGSIAMDRRGNMALGYSVSSSTVKPSIRYTGRLAGDTLGTMGAENSVYDGPASQTGSIRWGDYTSMTVDPVDDCTFWYTNEYVGATGTAPYNWHTRIASFRFPACGKAVMISPAPGSTLSGPNATFTWGDGVGVTNYYLKIGTTAGGTDVLDVTLGSSTTSYAATNLPTTGATLYVRLSSVIDGTEQYNDYTYTEANQTKAAITSPTPGSTLSGSSATFMWGGGAGVTSYNLWIGTTTGGNDVANVALDASTTSYAANNLPTTGAALYVRLISVFGGTNQYNDYTYTQATAVKAAMISPAQGSTLPGSTVTFTWGGGVAVTGYQLWIGTTAGSSNVAAVTLGSSTTSYQANNLPIAGATLYVRLISVVNGANQYNDYTYVEAVPTKAAMISPTPGTQLAGASATFQWTAGVGVSYYQLAIGTTPGGSNIYSQWLGTSLSTTVNTLPTDGSSLYVRLYSYLGGAWQTQDYTYFAAGPAATPATMTSPASGTQLSGSSATFQWSAGVGVTYYQLSIGTALGGNNLYNQWLGTSRSTTVNTLPTDGSLLYVRLFSYIAGSWQSRDYAYLAAGGSATPAVITSPTPGTQLAGSSATFQWTAGIGVSYYQLAIGTTPGGSNIYNQWLGTNLSTTVNTLPSNGASLYVRLYSYMSGTWQSRDFIYFAAGPAATPATMTSPTPGTQLSGSSAMFQWTAGTGVTYYQLAIGTTPGGNNIYYQWLGTSLSTTVNTLPISGGMLYVRLYSYIGGNWQSRDYTYIAAGTPSPATITSPTPGTQLSGSSVIFQWSAGTGVTYYQLSIGTTPGGSNIYNQWLGTNLSTTVNTLPTNGATLYVRLYSYIAGTWQSRDCTYYAAGGTPAAAAITNPLPGTQLSGSSVNFQWSAGSGVTYYQLSIGTAPGGTNVYNQWLGASLSATVNGLPTGGITLYVRLWSYMGGTWDFRDYTYTAAP